MPWSRGIAAPVSIAIPIVSAVSVTVPVISVAVPVIPVAVAVAVAPISGSTSPTSPTRPARPASSTGSAGPAGRAHIDRGERVVPVAESVADVRPHPGENHRDADAQQGQQQGVFDQALAAAVPDQGAPSRGHKGSECNEKGVANEYPARVKTRQGACRHGGWRAMR
jgi:hypothetical protein